MSDLDFSHNVSEIPAGEALPKPYHRTVNAEVTPFPDIQSSVSNYAEATNWMSNVGSFVATKASNAIAEKIGTELGKNPQGDLGIPLTDFDKTMQNSYKTQSQATLGLQANKLITDANIEAAKATRITPDLIEKTNQNIALGLKNIFKNAPAELQPHLEYQFGNTMLERRANLSSRMFREQKEDWRNNTAFASDMNSQHAYSFGLHGNDKAAEDVLETTKKLNEAAVASRVITPEDAKSNIETARKSYLSGRLIHGYEAARADGKGEQYLKDIAEKKPSWLSDNDYMAVSQNLVAYVGHQESLRNQDQQLRVARFNTDVAMNPMSPDMMSKLQELKNNVSPIAYEKAQLHLIDAQKTFNRQQGDTNNALASWNDPASFARASAKGINKGFDMLVGRYVQQRQDAGNPVSQDEAEVQVAASAGGKVPVFEDSIKNKIHSGNPAQLDSAARQVDALYAMNASHAIQGLSQQEKAILAQFSSLRSALPPDEAARVAIQNANQKPEIQQMNKEKWAAYLKSQTGGVGGLFSTSPTDWALKQVAMSPKDFANPGIAHDYGNMVLQLYSSYFQMTDGDRQSALKLVQQEVKENFGYTGVNGAKTMTLHPIEKLLGYGENSDVVPFIQQDVMNQLNTAFSAPMVEVVSSQEMTSQNPAENIKQTKMVSMKEAFAAGKANDYWDIVPNDLKNHAHIYGHEYAPVQIKHYHRTANGVKAETYPVQIVGNSFNWDITLMTASGKRPLIQLAPYLGIHTYTPNQKAIQDGYLKAKRGK